MVNQFTTNLIDMSKTPTKADRHDQSRKTYQRVLGMIEHQTGGKQGSMVPKTTIQQMISRSNISYEDGARALQAAKENDDVLDWHGRLALTDEDSLRLVIEEQVESDTPRKILIGRCNQLLADLREADQ